MDEIRVGVQLRPQHAGYETLRRAWLEAEELGADMIFDWDHFYPLHGAPDGMHFEGLALEAALAEVTERAQVGCLVHCNSYRNPQYLADALRTIDHISGGRLIVGIGAGWFQRDYDEYGYEFGTAPDRLRALRRDLPLLKERLTKLNPPPLGPMPILIGGSGEQVTLRLVAEHGDMWHSFGDVDRYHAKSEVLARHCARVGRDPATVTRVWGIPPEDLGRAERLHAEGVTHFTIGIGGEEGHDLGPLRELVQWRDRANGGR